MGQDLVVDLDQRQRLIGSDHVGQQEQLAGLGGEGVAGGLHDGGEGAGAGFGNVEICGDVEAGLGFEDDFFDAVVSVVDGAGDLNVEGCFFGGEAADPTD